MIILKGTVIQNLPGVVGSFPQKRVWKIISVGQLSFTKNEILDVFYFILDGRNRGYYKLTKK